MAFRYSGAGWRVAGSIRAFGDQIMELRGHTNSYAVDGTLGNLEHSNRTSDHNPDDDGIVRAIDFFEHEPGFVDDIGETLRAARDPRLKYFIHDTRMFASYSNSKGPAWEWREYTGINGHETHGHLSVVASSIADQDHEWELNMPLSDEDVQRVAQASALATANLKVSRGSSQISWIQETADTKTLLLAQSLDANHLTDAELDNAVNNLINALPQATLDLLKAKL